MSKLSKLMQLRQRVLLVGPPGCGKTARIKAAAKEAGLRIFLGIGGRTCDLMDRLDASGCVMPDRVKGVARVFPLQELRDIMDCQTPALWFLDEIGRAPLDVQGALCSVMDSLRAKDSPVVVWAATNRPGDRAGVGSISAQVTSRFDRAYSIATPKVRDGSLTMPSAEDTADGPVQLMPWYVTSGECEVAAWCDWAASIGAPPEVLAFHLSQGGRNLYAAQHNPDPSIRYPDFRGWESVIHSWSHGLRSREDVAASIGKACAVEFLAYCKLADELPTPDQVRHDPKGAKVPAEPSAQWLIAGILANAVDGNWLGRAVQYFERLPIVPCAFGLKLTSRRLGADTVRQDKAWQKWFLAHQDLFL